MFGLNGFEIPLIVLLALLFFGGKKLPELAKGFGESLRVIKKEVSEVSTDMSEIKDEVVSVKEAVKAEPKKKTAKN